MQTKLENTDKIVVAGRVMASRESKKVSFADISELGQCEATQLVFSKELLPTKLPLGSVVKVAGKLVLVPERSHQKEIKVSEIIYLSKPEPGFKSPFPWIQVEAPRNEAESRKARTEQLKADRERVKQDQEKLKKKSHCGCNCHRVN